MAMTKKDYARAARIVRGIRKNRGEDHARVVRESFRLLFWKEPRFDHVRFNEACEGTDDSLTKAEAINE